MGDARGRRRADLSQYVIASLAGLLLQACATVAPRGGAPDESVAFATVTGAYLAGGYAADAGDYRTARDIYEAALKGNPNNVALRRRAFELALRDGDVEAAADHAAVLHAEGEASPAARLILAVESFARRDFDDARFFALEARGGVNDTLARTLTAWSIAAEGREDEALAMFNAAGDGIRIPGVRPMADALLLQRQGRWDQAELAFKVLAGARPSDLAAAEAYGRLLETRGRLQAAEAFYAARDQKLRADPVAQLGLARLDANAPADAAYPDDARRGAALAFVRFAEILTPERPTYALLYASLATRLDPTLDLAWFERGEAAERLADHLMAAESFAAVDPASPLRAAAQLSRVAALYETGSVSAAMAALEDAFPESDRGDVQMWRGHLFRDLGRFDLAIAAYSDAIAGVHPGSGARWAPLFYRGVAKELAGDWAGAEQDLRSSLALRPNDPTLLNYLGYLLIDRGGDLEEGLALASRAAALDPGNGNIVDSVGWGYFQLGDFDRAADRLEDAAQLEPANPVIIGHLGDAYWRLGRLIEARRQWSRALELEPEPALEDDLRDRLSFGLAAESGEARAAASRE